MVTHIFFNLHGVLIDGKRMLANHKRGLGQIMFERYGQASVDWENSYEQIIADWDSYFADLNLSGEDMLRDLNEGWFRVTRALFRIVNVDEPLKAELSKLSLELPSAAPAYGNAMYEDARTAINQLHDNGYQLGVITHSLAGQARAALRGARMLDKFSAPIVGADTVEQFDKDRMYFLKVASHARVKPENCLVVDTHDTAIAGAKAAGMRTVTFNRHAKEADSLSDWDALLSLDYV